MLHALTSEMLHALTSYKKHSLPGGSMTQPKAGVFAPPVPSFSNQSRLGMLQRKTGCGCGGSAPECVGCNKGNESTLQRRVGNQTEPNGVPPIVHEVLRSPGHPLDAKTRAFLEPRFEHDFGNVRVHTGNRAEESARTVNALAYTVGKNVVFDAGQYAPETANGKRLLAHELTHVLQQRGGDGIQPQTIGVSSDAYEQEADRTSAWVVDAPAGSIAAPVGSQSPNVLQRTPANKVSCGASAPLQLPDGTAIADPVGVITAAEDRANALLDDSINELDFTRQQILAGSPAGFPTVSDPLGAGMKLMGVNPDSDSAWRGNGLNSAGLLLRRLRLIRSTIGAGSFFFTCLGPQNGTIGSCAGPICAGGNVAASCDGSFQTNLCPPFWQDGTGVEGQAAVIVHESSHNFAAFVQHSGREGNAFCFERFPFVATGTPEPHNHTGVCPDV
jgi:hypothetical protein